MKKLLLEKVLVTLFILAGLASWSSMSGQGTETFDNFAEEGNSYEDGTFTGQDGSAWTYTQCRGDYEITGKAIMIGRNRDPQANFYSGTIAGGIGVISFDYKQAFSSNVNLNVLVNDVLVGNVTTSDEQNVEKNSGNIPVNVEGDVVIKFINENNSDGQVVIDNVTWTAPGPAGTLSDLVLSSYDLTTDEEITITWTASDVAFLKFQVRDEPDEGEWYDLEGLENIDATLGTINFTIPVFAADGDNVLRITDTTNPSVFTESAVFTITDNHFAGLHPDMPFFPANGATDVPIDLFGVIEPEMEEPFTTMQQLLMHFDEDINPGTGNITLYKTDGDVLVKAFDVAGTDVDFFGPAIGLIVGENLEPNTQYYVTVDAGAILDQANTPNAFDGVVTWSFTTGAGDSYVSISQIRGTEDVPALMGQVVNTGGLVTHIMADGSRFWIQDDNSGYNGLQVYDSDAAGQVTVGDWVAIIGEVGIYSNIAQLTGILNVDVTSQGNPVSPTLITMPFIEKWESMLVKVENVTYTNAPLSFGEFEVTDGTNTGLIDEWLFAYVPDTDEQFESITGIMNYSYDNFKIAPRDANDIVSTATSVTEPDAGEVLIAPNPVSNLLYITADEAISSVQLINTAGSVVKEVKINADAQTTLSVSDLPKGLYLIRISTISGENLIEKVIKR